jgi:hypothetical protein
MRRTSDTLQRTENPTTFGEIRSESDRLKSQAEKFNRHLIDFHQSRQLFQQHLEKGDPFSYIRLTDVDILGWLYAHNKHKGLNQTIPDEGMDEFIAQWLPYTGLSDVSHFPSAHYVKCILDTDLVGVQQPCLSQPKLWIPTLQFLIQAKLLDEKKWIDMHTHCSLITYDHLFQHFIGKKVVWVGAKAPVFEKYFKHEHSYQKMFPQLHLNAFDLITIETPEIGQHSFDATEITLQQIRDTYASKPDYFLFSTGLSGRLLIPQIVQDGYTALDMGAALDTLMNLPEKRPCMEIFSQYQHPDIVIDAPGHYWIETIRSKTDNQLLYERNQSHHYDLWNFKTESPSVDTLLWKDKFNHKIDSLEETQTRLLNALKENRPFSFIRFTDHDIADSLKKYRPEPDWPSLFQSQEDQPCFNQDLFPQEEFAHILLQSDFVGLHTPSDASEKSWLTSFEALRSLGIWHLRSWQPMQALSTLTQSGALFQAFEGKHVVWVGTKAPVFQHFFYGHPAYRKQFPQLGLDAFRLTSIGIGQIPPNLVHDNLSQVLQHLKTYIYPQKPDVFLLSCGVLSRYLAPKLSNEGYIAFDMGSILEALMGLPSKEPGLGLFSQFEHPDIVIHVPNQKNIDSIFSRKTGECLYNSHMPYSKLEFTPDLPL